MTKFIFRDQSLSRLIKTQSSENKTSLTVPSLQNNSVQLQLKNQVECVNEFFTLLATAHECLAQDYDSGFQSWEEINSNVSYGGPSPDEITLVDAAKNLGYAYIGGSGDKIETWIGGKKKEFKLFA